MKNPNPVLGRPPRHVQEPPDDCCRCGKEGPMLGYVVHYGHAEREERLCQHCLDTVNTINNLAHETMAENPTWAFIDDDRPKLRMEIFNAVFRTHRDPLETLEKRKKLLRKLFQEMTTARPPPDVEARRWFAKQSKNVCVRCTRIGLTNPYTIHYGETPKVERVCSTCNTIIDATNAMAPGVLAENNTWRFIGYNKLKLRMEIFNAVYQSNAQLETDEQRKTLLRNLFQETLKLYTYY